MKHSDLRVGGEYAWKKYSLPGRVKVVSRDVTITTGRGYRARNTRAVEIEIIAESYYHLSAGDRRIVPTREILAPWAEYEARQAAEEREVKEAERQQEAEDRRIAESLASVEKVLADHGLQLHLNDWSRCRYLVNIDELAEVLGDLVRAAYKRGVQRGLSGD